MRNLLLKENRLDIPNSFSLQKIFSWLLMSDKERSKAIGRLEMALSEKELSGTDIIYQNIIYSFGSALMEFHILSRYLPS